MVSPSLCRRPPAGWLISGVYLTSAPVSSPTGAPVNYAAAAAAFLAARRCLLNLLIAALHLPHRHPRWYPVVVTPWRFTVPPLPAPDGLSPLSNSTRAPGFQLLPAPLVPFAPFLVGATVFVVLRAMLMAPLCRHPPAG